MLLKDVFDELGHGPIEVALRGHGKGQIVGGAERRFDGAHRGYGLRLLESVHENKFTLGESFAFHADDCTTPSAALTSEARLAGNPSP